MGKGAGDGADRRIILWQDSTLIEAAVTDLHGMLRAEIPWRAKALQGIADSADRSAALASASAMLPSVSKRRMPIFSLFVLMNC